MLTRIPSLLLALCALLLVVPAQAAVTITFWSHELGSSFPHAFFTLRGVPDAGGAAVDANYGFTPTALTPAILMGTVPGRLDIAKPAYIANSDAQFSMVLSDAQYRQVMALVAAWDERTGNGDYHMNRRNCVHFVQQAAKIAGVAQVDFPALMKKPRSYLRAVAAANAGQVRVIDMNGKAYLASLPPLVTASAASASGAALTR